MVHPHTLARRFRTEGVSSKGLVPASLGGFGHYDKHGVFQGRVHYPLKNQDGCNPFKESDFDDGHLKEASFDGHKSIIMVDRGNCHFVKKVQNIQKFGAIMAIVVDRHDEESITMRNDGHGDSIRIPAFLIGKRDGNTIKEAIHEMSIGQINQGGKSSGWDDSKDGEKTNEEQDVRKNRNWANQDESNRDQYLKKGHQVIMQGVIGGKVERTETVNVDIWYNSVYELYRAGWNLRDLARISDEFHENATVKI